MKKILIFSLCFLMILTGTLSVGAADAVSAVQIENLMPFDLDCRSAVLMDSATGTDWGIDFDFVKDN